jgi:hypothetical protein
VVWEENNINDQGFGFFKDRKVMTENFAERFVDHRNVGLACYCAATRLFAKPGRGTSIPP